ncbi:hypothetical protein [Flectobacillus roseus]|uniref:hypothetical protein n=1 Tax=Flectobacillus roseus TaxID=502259 RepID=UPI0024B73023|nr:hypothetical protein [Flectobacillus roseus]MDI9871300.1 hypothetical protein [Flectobacillus roseus]
MQKPSIGRIVIYHLAPLLQKKPAIVTSVISDSVINIAILCEEEQGILCRFGVLHKDHPDAEGIYWDWPERS